MEKKSAGVIGLGTMGSAMAANLVRAGFTVHGFDVSASAVRNFKKSGGVPAASPAALAEKASIVVSSLPSASALFSTVSALKGKCTVIETSTLPIEDKLAARKILDKKGITLLDCPLSGTGAQAKTKDLVVLGSGDEKSFRKTIPVLKGFSRAHYFLGEFGNGSKMKFVANLLVAIHNVSTAEAFVLGMKAGLSPELIYKVVSDGAGTSRMFQVRGPQMVAGRYDDATMKLDLWQKDMRIIGEFAAGLGVATPLFSASAPVYDAAMTQGLEKQDTAAVCAVLERMSGIRRKRRG